MDDYKIWFYLILGAVYLLSRLRKKPEAPSSERQQPATPATDVNTRPVETAKPLTFDELLREIAQTKEPQQPTTYRPAPVSKGDYVDYDDDLKEEAQDLEDPGYEDYSRKERTSKAYEDAKTAAFYRPSLEETMKIEDTVVNFSKFKVFEEEKRRNLLEEYTRDLRDPEGLKKAVVLSEILNRRF